MTLVEIRNLIIPEFSPIVWCAINAESDFPFLRRLDAVIHGFYKGWGRYICVHAIQNSEMLNFALGILSSIVAAMIVALIVRVQLFLYPSFRPAWNILKSVRRLQKAGINNIMTSRTEFRFLKGGETIPRYLVGTVKYTLIYVGFWHAKGVEMENLRNVFINLASKGCAIEMVLLDPEIDDFRITFMAKHMGLSATAFRHRLSDAWEEMIQHQREIPAQFRRNFVLKAHTEVIYSSAFVIDFGHSSARTLVDFKLFGTEREGAFAIELVPTSIVDSLYQRLTESFMAIRDAARVRNANLQVITNGRKENC